MRMMRWYPYAMNRRYNPMARVHADGHEPMRCPEKLAARMLMRGSNPRFATVCQDGDQRRPASVSARLGSISGFDMASTAYCMT
ncbi:hypothetical protein ACVISU_003455 [Bradyrhizobium sp. USDA 4452]